MVSPLAPRLTICWVAWGSERLGEAVERLAQVWLITDKDGQELGHRFPSSALRRLVKGAQAAGEDSYHVDARDGVRTLLHPFTGRDPHFALYSIRRENLPAEEAAGRIQPLSIPQTSGLAEGTHFLFMPRNVVICLYNHHGPRIRRLGAWIKDRVDIEVGFVPLYRTDTWDLVDRMQRITGVEVSVPAGQLVGLQSQPDATSGGLLGTLEAAAAAGDGRGTISLRMSVGRGQAQMHQSVLRRLATQLLGMEKHGFTAARIVGKNEFNHTTAIDLLHEQLVSRRTVEAESSRDHEVSASSAHEEMVRTFEEFRQQIEACTRPVDVGGPGTLALIDRESDDVEPGG